VTATHTELADRCAIEEVVSRFGYTYDERRLEVLKEILTDDAVLAYSLSGSPVVEIDGRAEVITWLSDIMQRQSDQRRHNLSNIVIDFVGCDRATVQAYLCLYAVSDQARLITTGFYRFDLIKRSGSWKVSYLLDCLDRPF
jgi:hypothetical protein